MRKIFIIILFSLIIMSCDQQTFIPVPTQQVNHGSSDEDSHVPEWHIHTFSLNKNGYQVKHPVGSAIQNWYISYSVNKRFDHEVLEIKNISLPNGLTDLTYSISNDNKTLYISAKKNIQSYSAGIIMIYKNASIRENISINVRY